MNRPSYYPPQYQAALARQWRYSAKGIAVLGLLGCSSLLASLYVERLAILAAATLAIFLVFAWASVWAIYDTYRYVRIVPYFDRTVGDIDTYTAGRELARYCSKLDAMAVASGQQAISAFGFNDDLRGETLVWHSPSDGLQTVAALMAAVAAQPEEFVIRGHPCLISRQLGEAIRKHPLNAIRGDNQETPINSITEPITGNYGTPMI